MNGIDDSDATAGHAAVCRQFGRKDARNVVRFGVTGGGALLNNLGTSTGSRVVEAYNGRAVISLRQNGVRSVASVSSKGLPTAFLPLD